MGVRNLSKDIPSLRCFDDEVAIDLASSRASTTYDSTDIPSRGNIFDFTGNQQATISSGLISPAIHE
jgi:hypothetical protein